MKKQPKKVQVAVKAGQDPTVVCAIVQLHDDGAAQDLLCLA